MSFRGFSAGLSALVLSIAFGTAGAAGCSQTSDVHPLLDGGSSGAGGASSSSSSSSSTSSSSSSSSSSASSTSSSSSSSSSSSGGCSAFEKCAMATDCPKLATTCITNTCVAGCCAQTPAGKETPCTEDGGKVCDGAGHCVGCASNADCGGTLTCVMGQCLVAHCTDGMQDDGETDKDCGGPDCAPCADGLHCALASDCVDKVCSGMPLTCQPATCKDGVKNGTETDVDCGGACPPCVDNGACLKGSDCQSLDCVNMKCAAATCTDGIKNQDETDTDCGGLHCDPCLDGKGCKVATDCVDKVCSGTPATCQAPTCTDGVQNGTETDIDCGGGSCPLCPIGEKCHQSSDCVGNICQLTCQCPLGMLGMPIQGGGVYCIDLVEVTYTQYSTFYSANPSTASQPAYCSWNLNWTPTGQWPMPTASGGQPVRYVNWCQAAAYCEYSGKRLCGKIGGGPVPQSAFADFHQDQWFNACSAEGVNCSTTGCYPYGTVYSASACNGGHSGGAPVAEMDPTVMSCLGGAPNLLNMSGNVAEWEDSCATATGMSDACAVRGGSYQDSAAALRCDSGATAPITQPRNYTGEDVGFRCCL